MRKKALVVGAGRIGATKLATGHNLDDEAQSVLMNVFRGDLPRLIRNSGMDSSGRFIPRIKPLSLISEKEIALYLMLNNAWNVLPECPYTRFALRREVRSLLSGFEYRHPGTMLHLIESKQKIERSCKGSVVSEPLKTCRGCGDPSSGEFCQVCQLRQSRLTARIPDYHYLTEGNALRVTVDVQFSRHGQIRSTVNPVFSAISTESVVVALRETMMGIFAIKHLRTISEDMRPDEMTNVCDRSTPLRSAWPIMRSTALCLPISSATLITRC